MGALQAWLWRAFDWFANNRPAQIVALVIAGLAAMRSRDAWLRWRERERVRKEAKLKGAVVAHRTTAAMAEARRETSTERTEDAQRADDAVRDLPPVSSLDRLRDMDPGLYATVTGKGGSRSDP